MRVLLLSCVASTLIASLASSTKCYDDNNYKYNNYDDLNCMVLRRTETLRQEYCTYDEVAEACPVTCGICCFEDARFKFKLKGVNKSCKWIGNKMSRRKKYCFKYKKKNEIKAACAVGCDLCREPVIPMNSAPPSSMPTSKPTSTPTHHPSPMPSPYSGDPWSFIALADWHKAEYFAVQPTKKSAYYIETLNQIKYINENYGGDLVVLPGDTNGALPGEKGGGKWDEEEFANVFKPDYTIKRRVALAGKNCYKAVRDLFSSSGYPVILVALGDHEIGGNSWNKQDKRKLEALPEYHDVFKRWYNTDYDKKKLLQFREHLGSVSSRPERTEYENSSFAHRHKNVLFVTVNSFKKMDDTFLDREHGLGGEGVITCTVDGEHLRWFTNVLREARKDASIRHIIVQSHVPVIQPVRKVACSGQFMDDGEESPFWKRMVKYGVDVYLAGEVHANTATKDPDSNLVQIVSRGNQFSNFLKIEVTDYTLNITSYNEVGTKRFNNMNYEVHGRLLINKSDCMPSSQPSLSTAPSSGPSLSSAPSISPTSSPSTDPTSSPSTDPTPSPSTTPSSSPSTTPTSLPSISPTSLPSTTPTSSPSTTPTSTPSSTPTSIPSSTPTFYPSTDPTSTPSSTPSSPPSISTIPTSSPSTTPSYSPSMTPTSTPSTTPTSAPSTTPTYGPSTTPTSSPSNTPTSIPSTTPTSAPSISPTTRPSSNPTSAPSTTPTSTPSTAPTSTPSTNPTSAPSMTPTSSPSTIPTSTPSTTPTFTPSTTPSTSPSTTPSSSPSTTPTSTPSINPTTTPSVTPTSSPSMTPTSSLSTIPTSSPSITPTSVPSTTPTTSPSTSPSSSPSTILTSTPSINPTTTPSITPSSSPSMTPTSSPSTNPTSSPSTNPTSSPSDTPTSILSITPTSSPSANPSNSPSATPTSSPSIHPSSAPSTNPTSAPSTNPSSSPSTIPTSSPSIIPTSSPSEGPTSSPSTNPTSSPSDTPTSILSITPTSSPSANPSYSPSTAPTSLPSIHPSSAPSTVSNVSNHPEPSLAPSTQAPSNAPICINNDSYRYNSNSKQSCTWVRAKEERRLILCQLVEVVDNCPMSCGECCEDDKTYTFSVGSNTRNCEWLSLVTYKYCDTYKNGRMVNYGCPKSCNVCKTQVSAIPSPGPSIGLTTLTSEKPSISASTAPTNKLIMPSQYYTQQPSLPSLGASMAPSSSSLSSSSPLPSTCDECRDSHQKFSLVLNKERYQNNCASINLQEDKDIICAYKGVSIHCPVTCDSCTSNRYTDSILTSFSDVKVNGVRWYKCEQINDPESGFTCTTPGVNRTCRSTCDPCSSSSNHLSTREGANNRVLDSFDPSTSSICDQTIITSSGALELLDRTSALIHFNFEEILPLGSRQVIGLQHDDHFETLVAKSITIRGTKCKESLPNLGTFAELYDAQIANIRLIRQPSSRGSYSAKFSKNSRFGIFGNGPHTPGQPVSFGIWIKVSQTLDKQLSGKKNKKKKEMILVHYGHTFMGATTKKDIFTLTLKNGKPRLYTSPTGILIPENPVRLNDNNWHHIVISMPKQNCKLSEVDMFINGENIQTKEPDENKHIFFTTSGKLSVGGFGHSHDKFELLYPHLSSFVGEVDDFSVWARPIEARDFPSNTPSSSPSTTPTSTPSINPTSAPSFNPTTSPSTTPTFTPSTTPSNSPSTTPSSSPSTTPTPAPSIIPTTTPSVTPTSSPSMTPTSSPSITPTSVPSTTPTSSPSTSPSSSPSTIPTSTPSINPTTTPSITPSSSPSTIPTSTPSTIPTSTPSSTPSSFPSISKMPTSAPSTVPTSSPSGTPSSAPSFNPTSAPSTTPTLAPSTIPTCAPSITPTSSPSITPTDSPSIIPTSAPSIHPTFTPSSTPSSLPSISITPTSSPSTVSTSSPSGTPSSAPSINSTSAPSTAPTSSPSINPTTSPFTSAPSTHSDPSVISSNTPSTKPSKT